jgi:hypothetical protein
MVNCPEGTYKKAPSYTISGRGKDVIDSRVGNPGPGKYESSNLNAMKEKAPSYSLSNRTVLPSDDTKKPGPGAHSPEKVSLTSTSQIRISSGSIHQRLQFAIQ